MLSDNETDKITTEEADSMNFGYVLVDDDCNYLFKDIISLSLEQQTFKINI